MRESVALYYAQVKRQRAASRFLALAGTGDSGRSDSASGIKAHVAQAIDDKFARPHPLRPK